MSSLDCEVDHVYVKVIKRCNIFAAEESYQILAGNTVVARSPVFEDEKTRTSEYCLPQHLKNQYTIKLIDKFGDGWSGISYVEIRGSYENVFMKAIMQDKREETYSLSLYYPIIKNDLWKVTSLSVEDLWTEYSFLDSSWTSIILSNPSLVTNGTQFFRKQFFGLEGMAAYEVQLFYRYGIVAYINGAELYRDNMPSGTIQPSTHATGGYLTSDYRGFIRNGMDVVSSQSILAVELHFPEQSPVTTISFNAFVSLYTSSTPSRNCYRINFNATITSSQGSNPSYINDYDPNTRWIVNGFDDSPTINFSFSNIRAFVNAIGFNPSTYPTAMPQNYILGGSNDQSSPISYTTIMQGVNRKYQTDTYTVHLGYFVPDAFKTMRLSVLSTEQGGLVVSEMHFMVCGTVNPTTIIFSPAILSVYISIEDVKIRPDIDGLSNCTMTQTLPAGMLFDSTTCSVSGIATTSLPRTIYTITAGIGISGTFSLTVIACSGSIVEVERTYQQTSSEEGFNIVETDTDKLLMDEPIGSVYKGGMIMYRFCVVTSRITASVMSSTSRWNKNSEVDIYVKYATTERELLAHLRYDMVLGIPTTRTLGVKFVIDAKENWFYKMGAVPNGWTSDDSNDWSVGSFGSFPASTNQIQLYKRKFTVTSLEGVIGVLLHLRHNRGSLIYLNGIEASRMFVTGDLTMSTFATNSYSGITYRSVSLPARRMTSDANMIRYLKVGENSIAIAIVGVSAVQLSSSFDCAIRLMTGEFENRVNDYTASQIGYVAESASVAFQEYSVNSMKVASCSAENSITLQFNGDRREWISSFSLTNDVEDMALSPSGLIFQARNSNDEEWITLKTVSNMRWWIRAQEKRVFVINNLSFNQYRWTSMSAGVSGRCIFTVARLAVFADDLSQTVPTLSYPETVSAFKNIEMAEIIPNSELFTDFTISPHLPEGLAIDSASGVLLGTPTVISTLTLYVISAKLLDSTPTTASLSLDVIVCTGEKSLITLVIRTDSYPENASYKLYRGNQPSSDVIASTAHLPYWNTLFYADFCLQFDVYTVTVQDSDPSGWSFPAGFMLTVDTGYFRFDTGHVPKVETGVTVVTTTFSSYIPFQAEHDSWRVLKTAQVEPIGWKTTSFDDVKWETLLGSAIGIADPVTIYLRRSFNIPSLEQYHVLNVRLMFGGGLIAYLNGNIVARFNLPAVVTKDTNALSIHDNSIHTFFHIILASSGAQLVNNVIAIELHRTLSESSSTPITFAATGVFGVMPCSLVRDTYEAISASELVSGTVNSIMDYSPMTSVSLPNEIGTHITWTTENLEGSRFNHYGFEMASANRISISFSLYARSAEEHDWISIHATPAESMIGRTRYMYSSPAGIVSYRFLKWEQDTIASESFSFSTLLFSYCTASGSICPSVGMYPAVAEGEISPAACDYGYTGYSYRRCTDGVLGDIILDMCVFKTPYDLSYGNNRFILVKDVVAKITKPTVTNLVQRYYLEDGVVLPTGLILDEKTGVISGIPTFVTSFAVYKIFGSNQRGIVSVDITISVRLGECAADGDFLITKVGESFDFQCSSRGGYIGVQHRMCSLGQSDGIWMKTSGVCVSIGFVVFVSLAVIVVVAIAIYIVVRMYARKKKGGVKSKKHTIKKTTTKKVVTKKAKV